MCTGAEPAAAAAATGSKAAADVAAAEGATALTGSAAAGEAAMAASTDALVGATAANTALGAGGSLLASGAAGEAAAEGAAGALTGIATGAAAFPGAAAANAAANAPTLMDTVTDFSKTKLGQSVLSSAAAGATSTLLQAALAPDGMKSPQVPKVNAMPTSESAEVMAAKKRSIAQQMKSRGRASTILTDKLG